jgi:hypothetical protein
MRILDIEFTRVKKRRNYADAEGARRGDLRNLERSKNFANVKFIIFRGFNTAVFLTSYITIPNTH